MYLKNKKIKVSKIALPILIFLLALCIRIPFYETVFWRTPDAAEYINVARNLNAGKGLTQSIKWQFFEDSPVETSALRGRPIGTSVIISLVLKIYNGFYSPQIFILLLSAINVLIFYFLAKIFLSNVFATAATLFVAFNPNILISSRSVLSEHVAIFFILLAFLTAYKLKEKIIKPVVIGVMLALAYLTRVETLFLLPFFIYNFRENKKFVLLTFLSFFIITLPYFAANYNINGNPFYTYNTHHFRVDHFADGMEKGFGKSFPSHFDYIKNNIPGIADKIFAKLVTNVMGIFDLAFFGLLTIPLFLYFYKGKRKFLIEIGFSFCVFLWYTITWSAFIETERGFMIIYFLLLIPAFIALSKLKMPLVLLIILLTGASYLAFDIHRISWVRNVDAGQDEWSLVKRERMYSWITKHTEKNDIIAAPSPWMINLFTARPSIILPTNLNGKSIIDFVEKYNVSYLITQSEKSTYDALKKVYSEEGGVVYCLQKCDK
jgi:4-amino-4-deoxy-L-arabinose transferase-like glycosyltransferase